MVTSFKSNLTYLKNNEFEILAKCVLTINQLNGSSPPEPITFEKLFNTNLKEVKPWWLFDIFPPMFILYSEKVSEKYQIKLFTHLNVSMGGIGDDWNHRTVFEGDFRRFNLEKILETEYPNLENRKNWENAISSYAKGLDLEIKVVNSGWGKSASDYGYTDFGGIIFNQSSYYSIQNRARVIAYLENGVKIYEHLKYPQIQDVSGLDAWINLQSNKPYIINTCRSTMSEEIANLNRYYNSIAPLYAQKTITIGESKFNPILAEQKLKELLDQVPNFVAARYNYAHVLEINKKLNKALEQLIIAVDLAPEDPWIWEKVGSIHSELGNIDNALECFHIVLELDPSRFFTYYNIAYIYRKKGDYQKSVDWTIEALNRMDNSHSDYWQDRFDTLYMLAVGYMNLFDFRNEISAIDACLEIVPNEPFLIEMKQKALLNRPVVGLY